MRTLLFAVMATAILNAQETRPNIAGPTSSGAPEQRLSIRDYGAQGAPNVDTVPIQKAIAAAHAAHKAIFIPVGVYITDPITDLQSDDCYYGEPGEGPIESGGNNLPGAPKSVLMSRNGGDVFSFSPSQYAYNIRIQDLTIRGAGKGSGRGIAIIAPANRPSSMVRISHVYFDNIAGTCLFAPDAFTIEIDNVSGLCGGNGIDIGAGNTAHLGPNLYIQRVGDGKAAYRIHGGHVLFDTVNGINGGANADWAVLGDERTTDGTAGYVFATFLNCNVEDYTNRGLYFKAGSKLVLWSGGKIEAPKYGTVTAMQFDYVAAAGDVFGLLVTSDGAAYRNGEPIHSRGVPFIVHGPLQGIGSGGPPSTYSGESYYDDGDSVAENLPTENAVHSGAHNNAVQWNRVSLPEVDLFFLNGVKQQYVTTPPTSCRTKGEIAWNKQPDAGSPVGWVCTVVGPSPIWNPFGYAGSPAATMAGTNHTTCWKASGAIGYCSTAPSQDGACKCN
jgi:hypothetical protein